MGRIKIVNFNESLPICRYCERQLTTIEKMSKGVLDLSVIYFCPHCKKFLGIVCE